MIERVTVVKFRVNYEGGNGAGCFEVFWLRSDIGRQTVPHAVGVKGLSG